MAVKIPTYEDRLVPQGAGPSPVFRPAEQTDAIGRGLQNLGNAATDFAATNYHLEQKRQLETDINNLGPKLANASVEWPNRVAVLAKSAVDGSNIPQADGSVMPLTKAVESEWSHYREQFLGGITNEKARMYASSHLDSVWANTYGNSLKTEATLNVSNKLDNINKTVTIFANQAAADTSPDFKTTLENLNTAKQNIASSGLDEHTRNQTALAAQKSIVEAAITGALKRDPTVARAALLQKFGVTEDQLKTSTGSSGAGVPNAKISQAGLDAITGTADRLGISSQDLRTIISYETGGTFDPSKRGGAGDKHIGLIQFGENEQKTYGANQKQSFNEQMIAVEKYLKDRGVQPGDDLKTLYKIVNGGNRNVPDTASDGNGTIAEHVDRMRKEHGGGSSGASASAPSVKVPENLSMLVAMLDADRVPAFLNEANAEVNRNNAVWNQTFDRDVADAQSAYKNSGVWTGRQFTQQDFERRAPGDGVRLFAEYQKEQQLGTDLQTVNTMGPEEIARLRDSYTPTTGPGAKLADERRDILERAIASSIKQRADDPAGFAVRTASNVKDAAAALAQSQTQSIDQQRAAADRYAVVTTAEQKRLGILSPRLLTDQQAAALGAQFKQQADGGNDAAQLMKTMATVWGNNWPRVFGEIYKDLPPVAQVLGALGPQVDSATSALIVQTAGMKPEELKAGLVPTVVTDVGVKTQAEFEGLKKTMSWQAGGLSQFSTLYNAAEKLAYVYVGQGMSASDAAAKAFNNTIGRNYTIEANMRIPKSLDSKQVLMGADRIFRDLPNMEFALPTGIPAGLAPKDAQAQYADGLKSAGIWVTSGDETGLILYDSIARTPVRTKDGKDVKFTWAQLLKQPVAPTPGYDPLTGIAVGGN